jgi:hypothetical protein
VGCQWAKALPASKLLYTGHILSINTSSQNGTINSISFFDLLMINLESGQDQKKNLKALEKTSILTADSNGQAMD